VNPRGVVSNYHKEAQLLFEGEYYPGQDKIREKFSSFLFKKITRKVLTFDCLPSGANNGFLVFVCGDVKFDDSENAIKFSQVFHIFAADPQLKNFIIYNDMFRLNYG